MFIDIIMDELLSSLPPFRSINHHIDLILGSTFPNKASCQMTPQENE